MIRNRTYVSATLVSSLGFAAMFAYISASPFVIQNVLELSTLTYAVLFGFNALGMIIGSSISIRLAGRVEVRKTLGVGVGFLLLVSLGLFVVAFAGAPTVPVLVLFFCVTFSMGLILGNATSIAMQAVTGTAGTGSAFMGRSSSCSGPACHRWLGWPGESDARPMAIVMTCCAVLAGLAYLGIKRNPRHPRDAAENGSHTAS